MKPFDLTKVWSFLNDAIIGITILILLLTGAVAFIKFLFDICTSQWIRLVNGVKLLTRYVYYHEDFWEWYKKRGKEYPINCLSYALRFWEQNKKYKIWYNSGHCINLPEGMFMPYSKEEAFLPATGFGYCYFSSAFDGLLTKDDERILKLYFNQTECQEK